MLLCLGSSVPTEPTVYTGYATPSMLISYESAIRYVLATCGQLAVQANPHAVAPVHAYCAFPAFISLHRMIERNAKSNKDDRH